MYSRTSSLANVFEFKELTHNKLTVIFNLNVFEEKLNKQIKKSTKNSKGMALLFIDSDRFNNTDDSLSFNYIDEFLEMFFKQLEEYMENKGILHRVSENKYLLCIYDIEDLDYFKNNIERKIKRFVRLRELESCDIYNSVNVGISIYLDHGYSAKELINKAKIAMYKAKELGRNKCYFFQDNIYKEMIEKKEIEKSLRNALKNNELLIYYQPQVDMTTSKIYGVEALLRWNSPKYGYMQPGKFISIAEETGIIMEIGEWILREVCIQAKKWQNDGFNIKMSINISAIQLQYKGFLNSIKKIINETNTEPSLIEFEITESILIESTKEVQKILSEIKNMGIKISLDDFGTGYSSLIYLNKFPIDTIKIDRSFVQDLFMSPKKTAIVEGIIHIAQNIGMDVIAEGIENKKELHILKEINCNRGQGYIYSKPLPINEIEIFLNKFTKNAIGLYC